VTSETRPAPSAPLSERELQALDAYWRAANYLSVGQIYLRGTRSCASRSPSRT
jgi:xylulose-5-phosphate/fructose-6-phosphate phosphoketolase